MGIAIQGTRLDCLNSHAFIRRFVICGIYICTQKRSIKMGLENIFNGENFVTTTFESVIKWAQKNSMWPMPLGISCCGIEMMGVAQPRFDIARFGSEVFRMTPRQSDFIIVAGTVTYKMAWVVRKIYDQMADPKWVMSMGVCARPVVCSEAIRLYRGLTNLFRLMFMWQAVRPVPKAYSKD